MLDPYKKSYIDQNTLLGAFRSGTTTIVTPPVSPVPRHLHHNATTGTNLQYQTPLERLSDIKIRNLEISFNGDINFETDSNSEPRETSNFPN